MTREQVDARLFAYRHNVGRAAHLREEIKHTEYLCDREAHRRAELAVSTTKPPAEVPGGKKITDVTGSTAAYLADTQPTPEARTLAQNLENMQLELYKLLRDIALVDGWVKCLSEMEKQVLAWRVFDGCAWLDVAALYEKAYGQICVEKTLLRKKAQAMEKIYRAAL